MSKEPTKPIPEETHNESDDDLDDLDDYLDKFTETPSKSPPSAPHQTTSTTTTSGRPRHNTRVDAPPRSIPGSGSNLSSTTEEGDVNEDALSQEFAQELAKGMESLMKELMSGRGLDPSSSSSSGAQESADKGTAIDDLADDETKKALKAAWEAMLLEGLSGNDNGGLAELGESLGTEGVRSGTDNSKAPSTGAPSSDFQNTIKQTLGKLRESESNLQSGSGSSSIPATESLEGLLKSLSDLGLGGGGEEDEELAGFLENMMGQLMSKEVLYEPLKELADNFPGYLANPPKPIELDDKTRYEKQCTYVRQIIDIFEKPTYDDANVEDSKTIMALMSEMQNYGSPPPEIMGPLPPGFANGIPQPGGEECIII